MFTQTLVGMRRPNQENPKKATSAQTANTSNKAEPENSGKAANGVNAQGQNVTIKNADGSTTNPETGVTTNNINGFA